MDKNQDYELIMTNDGSWSLFSQSYQESYHSQGGAWTEARDRFVSPCHIVKTATEQGKVSILDVGFGLGYNLAASLYALKGVTPTPQISVRSLEKDDRLMEIIPQLPFPPELEREYQIIRQLVREKSYCQDNLDLVLLMGEGQKSITTLEEKFDAVYQDAFSPRKNPELWTLEFFCEIRKRIAPQGMLSTYSSAGKVRMALLAAGFRIGPGHSAATKHDGTLASLEAPLPSFVPRLQRQFRNRFRREFPDYPGEPGV